MCCALLHSCHEQNFNKAKSFEDKNTYFQSKVALCKTNIFDFWFWKHYYRSLFQLSTFWYYLHLYLKYQIKLVRWYINEITLAFSSIKLSFSKKILNSHQTTFRISTRNSAFIFNAYENISYQANHQLRSSQ